MLGPSARRLSAIFRAVDKNFELDLPHKLAAVHAANACEARRRESMRELERLGVRF